MQKYKIEKYTNRKYRKYKSTRFVIVFFLKANSEVDEDKQECKNQNKQKNKNTKKYTKEKKKKFSLLLFPH